MEPIDWNKPIELMNGEPQVVSTRPILVGKYIEAGNGTLGFSTDNYGCIGGVQVVRNRKEPVKLTRYIYCWPEFSDRPNRVMVSILDDKANSSEWAKILVWRDENGKTCVEAVND